MHLQSVPFGLLAPEVYRQSPLAETVLFAGNWWSYVGSVRAKSYIFRNDW